MGSRKTVYKVRAVLLDGKGRAYAIRANKPHVLQLPGGSRKPDENPRKALRREIKEETGYRVTIVSEVDTITVKRNGAREITTAYICRIKGKPGRPSLTAAESRRGLRVKRYRDVNALRTALSERVTRYERSAARRDHRLATAAAQSI